MSAHGRSHCLSLAALPGSAPDCIQELSECLATRHKASSSKWAGWQVGPDYFRIHPKGVGMVVARAEGLPPLTFVEEYLGEVHAPWRWFEIQARAAYSQVLT